MDFPFTGVLPIDKPPEATSRQVVNAVARALEMRTVGHAGTLDPLAAGVVVVCVGHATKLIDFIHQSSKRYEAVFLLGRSSPSDDLETPIEEEADPRRPSWEEVVAALPAFRGAIMQRPCDYSAVHVGGQRAYRLARKGRAIEMPAKPVRVESLVATSYEWPRLALTVECSTGTFIRAIGRDLAAALGTRSVMESLVRTSVGPFCRDVSLSLADVSPVSVAGRLLPAITAVAHLPRVVLAGPALDLAVRGALFPASAISMVSAEHLAAVDEAGELVGILKLHASGSYRLRPNFRGLG